MKVCDFVPNPGPQLAPILASTPSVSRAADVSLDWMCFFPPGGLSANYKKISEAEP